MKKIMEMIINNPLHIKFIMVGIVAVLLVICFCFPICFPLVFNNSIVQGQDLFERDEGYFTVIDENENTILKTGRMLSPGNKYLNQDNELFRVTEVSEDTAYAEFVEHVELTEVNSNDAIELDLTIPAQTENIGPVGVYHSHGAESYVPSDGSESIDEGGGILDVGRELADSLEENTIDAIWVEETHVPHDAGAYMRSRRTVEELLQHNPSALIDVHRDAAPREEYKEEIEGDKGVQILFVIGQQQQNIAETESFAQRLKSIGDEMYPGLIKGVLYAEGDYNQDMHPRNILIEVGGHENTKEGAIESVDRFADVLKEELGGAEQDENGGIAGGLVNGNGTGPSGIMGTVGRSILWIIGAVIVGGGIFLAINAGRFEEIKNRFRRFVTTEFANFFGPINNKQTRKDQNHNKNKHKRKWHEEDDNQ